MKITSHCEIFSCFSKKFWRKVQFVSTLEDLDKEVAIGKEYIPESVLARDVEIMASLNMDKRPKDVSKEQEQKEEKQSKEQEQSSNPQEDKEKEEA